MGDYLANVFSASGPIATLMPNYESRPEQLEMAKAVSKAIVDAKILIVEAGTGVGKSFSYLIPVVRHALETETLAIISTNTISLQEQLIHKDIPFLEKVLDEDLGAVLVKGRKNYVCLRRLKRSNLKQKDLFSDEREMQQFSKIIAWSYRTKDGSLYDLDDEIDMRVWDIVSSDAENCLGKSCQSFKECFFQNAREKIKEARVLIVNHSLFFANLARHEEKKSIFPEYDAVIFDEAHTIENVATDHLGANISSTNLKFLMDILFNSKKQKGLLLTVGSQDAMEWVEVVRNRSDSFFKGVKKYFLARASNDYSDSLRVREANFIENTLEVPLAKLMETLLEAKKTADNKEDEAEISSFIKRINDIRTSLDVIINQTLSNYVYWVECSRSQRLDKVSINAAPINIGEILEKLLYSENKPMIFTSATLSIDNNSFEYFKDRMGIKGSEELQLGSPYNYKEQVNIYISKHMPNPNKLSEYALASSKKIKKYIALTNGNAFILFTSYSLMNLVYKELEDYLLEKDYNLLKQGDGVSRSKMLSRFKEKKGSILFGVDSFWQGIDVQGEALSNVIITKLPFQVPDHPVIEARVEDIQSKGKDAFMEYSLPEAVLRFKQGFGRLIRSKQDKGIVAILDSRIITKFYGRAFLNSIPECTLIKD
ncbi:MAG: helicase C-terminal domain-containing protein [Candidatus Omnitrophota bacterium]